MKRSDEDGDETGKPLVTTDGRSIAMRPRMRMRMASVQFSTNTLCSATLLLVVILGSVMCPPCKARQLMQTREERIEAVCDKLENKVKKLNTVDFGDYNYMEFSQTEAGFVRMWRLLPLGNAKKLRTRITVARFCENND